MRVLDFRMQDVPGYDAVTAKIGSFLSLSDVVCSKRCCRVMQMLPLLLALLSVCVRAQLSEDLSREQLKPLTAYRQQHRRLVCPPISCADA